MDLDSPAFQGAFGDLFDRIPEDLHRTPREVFIPEPRPLPVPPAAVVRRFSIMLGPTLKKWHLFEDLPGGGALHLQSFEHRREAVEAMARLEGSAS